MHVVAVADLNVGARAQPAQDRGLAGRAPYAASSLGDALKTRRARIVTENADALIACPDIEVIVEATGVPRRRHRPRAEGDRTRQAHRHGQCRGRRARRTVAGAQGEGRGRRLFSLAWGDQPALICEHVDWARACGFKVIAAGKGTRYEPHYHQSNPDNVWDILDKYLKIEDRNSINPKMFNSFVDGTKSGIEMTAVCNATGLVPQSDGLRFPPATRFELAEICKPKSAGGTLEKEGVTEVVSSVYRDGRDVPHHLALGTYVVFEGETEYARRCFKEYAMLPDKSGRYAALYRPIHMIGLELGISVAVAALRKEPTGAPNGFRSDVVATAKQRSEGGEMLDGEGGFCVWGKQTPADRSLDDGLLPLGLAHNVKLKRDIATGEALKWADVEYDANDAAVKVRREMEAAFGRRNVVTA